MAKHKEKPKFSKLVVTICITLIIVFTATCMFFLWNGRMLNDTLIVLFFGCFGIEFASLAFIRRGEMRWVEGSGDRKAGHVEKEGEDDQERLYTKDYQ